LIYCVSWKIFRLANDLTACFVSHGQLSASPNGSYSQRRTSFLPSQRVALRSAASISGRSNGFAFVSAPKLTSGSKPGLVGVRCEATVAEKETPVEKFEYQAEVY
jgi:hypothetical protein